MDANTLRIGISAAVLALIALIVGVLFGVGSSLIAMYLRS